MLKEPSKTEGYVSKFFYILNTIVNISNNFDSSVPLIEILPINTSSISFIGSLLNSSLTIYDLFGMLNVNESVYTDLPMIFSDQYDSIMSFLNSSLCDMSIAETLFNKINNSDFDIPIREILRMFSISFNLIFEKIDIVGRIVREDSSLTLSSVLSSISSDLEPTIVSLLTNVKSFIVLENSSISDFEAILGNMYNIPKLLINSIIETTFEPIISILSYFESFIVSTERGSIKDRLSSMKVFVNNVSPTMISMIDGILSQGKSMIGMFVTDFNFTDAFPISGLLSNYSQFFEWNSSIGDLFGCFEYNNSECSENVSTFVSNHKDSIINVIKCLGYDYSLFENTIEGIISNPFEVYIPDLFVLFEFNFSYFYSLLDLVKSLSVENNGILVSNIFDTIYPGLYDTFSTFCNFTVSLLNLEDISSIFIENYKSSFCNLTYSLFSVFNEEAGKIVGTISTIIQSVNHTSTISNLIPFLIQVSVSQTIPVLKPILNVFGIVGKLQGVVSMINLSMPLFDIPILMSLENTIIVDLMRYGVTLGDIVYKLNNNSEEYVTNLITKVSEKKESILNIIKKLGFQSESINNTLDLIISDPYEVEIQTILGLFNISIPSTFMIIEGIGVGVRGEYITINDIINIFSPSLVPIIKGFVNESLAFLRFDEKSLFALPKLSEYSNRFIAEFLNSSFIGEYKNSFVSFVQPIIFGETIFDRVFCVCSILNEILPIPIQGFIYSIDSTKNFIKQIDLNQYLNLSHLSNGLFQLVNSSLTFGDLLMALHQGSSEGFNLSIETFKSSLTQIKLIIKVLGYETTYSKAFIH